MRKDIEIICSLRDEHNEMMEIMTQILSHLNSEEFLRNTEQVQDLLSKLAESMVNHLKKEDKIFYPSLSSHPRKTISLLAKIYVKKMGGISDEFNQYIARWSDAVLIQDNANDFINETKDILEVLSMRINKEDNELYPLIARQ